MTLRLLNKLHEVRGDCLSEIEGLVLNTSSLSEIAESISRIKGKIYFIDELEDLETFLEADNEEGK